MAAEAYRMKEKNAAPRIAVLFDMDGVIFDSERLIIECWKPIAEQYQIPDIETPCRAAIGTTAVRTEEIFLEKYGAGFPYRTYAGMASKVFHERYGEGRLPLKKGVRELLAFLKEKEIPMALASSTRRAVVEQELTDAGIIGYFRQLICGDMIKRSKPAPDIFLAAAEALEASPSVCYVIEDSYNGIRAAHAAGMHPVMVPDLLQPTEEIRLLAEEIFPSLLEVKAFLEKKEVQL